MSNNRYIWPEVVMEIFLVLVLPLVMCNQKILPWFIEFAEFTESRLEKILFSCLIDLVDTKRISIQVFP